MSTDLKSILQLEVPLSVQIASRRMSMREVANLSPGAIIELPKASNEELEVVVSNRQIGFGTAVKVGENFGVRVTYIGDLHQRIAALAGEEVPMPPPEASQAPQAPEAPSSEISSESPVTPIAPDAPAD